MESLDIALKEIKAVFIYNMLREGVPKSNGIWEKKNTSGSTSGVRDNVRQGMCFLVTLFKGMRYLFAGIPTRSFYLFL